MLNTIFNVFVQNEIVIVENFFEVGKLLKEPALKNFSKPVQSEGDKNRISIKKNPDLFRISSKNAEDFPDGLT